jgi:hypothetical protein
LTGFRVAIINPCHCSTFVLCLNLFPVPLQQIWKDDPTWIST